MTLGDLQRITEAAHSDLFHILEVPDPNYTTADGDPLWPSLVTNGDGRRRVLKRTGARRCIFLGGNGCTLTIAQRPLLCRLYPYDFTEIGIRGIDICCPISHQPNWTDVLSAMEMPLDLAVEWHRMLYHEIRTEQYARLKPGKKPISIPRSTV